MRRVATLLLAFVLALGLATAAAYGQSVPTSDPSADSPSGTIYQIPLDSARADARPSGPATGSAGSVGSSRGSTAAGTSIHSENGFGSSATVPSAPERAKQQAGPERRPTSGDDGPSQTSGPDLEVASGGSGRSPIAAIALLAAVAIVGTGIGMSSRRGERAD